MVCRNDGERDTWTQDRLAVEVPVTHAHTIVQRVMRLSVSGAVGNTA